MYDYLQTNTHLHLKTGNPEFNPLLDPAVKHFEMSLKLKYSQPNIHTDRQENIIDGKHRFSTFTEPT